MSLLCGLGFHSWEFCMCSKCGKPRNDPHDWQGCKCRKCDKTRDKDHDWQGCKCRQCGTTRGKDHHWSRERETCVANCVLCGATNEVHKWSERQDCIQCELCGIVQYDIGGDADRRELVTAMHAALEAYSSRMGVDLPGIQLLKDSPIMLILAELRYPKYGDWETDEANIERVAAKLLLMGAHTVLGVDLLAEALRGIEQLLGKPQFGSFEERMIRQLTLLSWKLITLQTVMKTAK